MSDDAPASAQSKRARFITLVEEAEAAMAKAAKKIKLAKKAADDLVDTELPGVEDTVIHMDELSTKAATLWAASCSSRTILQDSGELISLRERQEHNRRADRDMVARVMEVSDPGFIPRASFLD